MTTLATLIVTDTTAAHRRAVPLAETRVRGIWGTGRLAYVTDDGWAGVQLDGETRVDEYPIEHLEPA